MVTRIGHMGLRVADLDEAVAFQCDVLGLVETERIGGVSYLTCNDRHHELILIQDGAHRGYDHIGLQVQDAAALEAARSRVAAAGGELIGGVYDGEPGIDRALRLRSPDGHVFKLFCGMQTTPAPAPGDRPIKFEHVSLKARNLRRLERFLQDGLGFRFSDRIVPIASWWHCDADHHGIAIALSPKVELAHLAYAWPDLNALGRVADRLRALRDSKPIWGPSRHGPGNNHFLYLLDPDGVMIENCSELAKMAPEGDYQPRSWKLFPDQINQWGGPPSLRFVRSGFPIADAP